MQELLDWLEYIEDDRQQRKVRHTLKDILVIVLFATLANADDWVEMALFAESYQDYLRKYIELKNGIPSHDTIRRVMGMISPEDVYKRQGAIRCASSGISPKTLMAFKRTAAEAPNRSLVFPVTILPSSNSMAAAGQESSSARFKHGDVYKRQPYIIHN